MDPFTSAALAGFAGKAAARLGGQQLANRIAALVNLQTAELKILHQLQADIDRVLAAPLFTATRLLSDANKEWRSDEDRERLLHEARNSLTQALALDSEPIRLSCAALLLGGVWWALGSPKDAQERVLEAYELGIKAARKLASSDPPPPGRLRRTLQLPRKYRPDAYRLATELELRISGITLVTIATYQATAKARQAEEKLTAIHDYTKSLRTLLSVLEEQERDLPEYEVCLTRSYNLLQYPFSLIRGEAHLYALRYRDLAEEQADTVSDGELSADRKRVGFVWFPQIRWSIKEGFQNPRI
ncbi:hypothetical protein ABZ307_20135 [Streptomyces griseorubiginosus]|uniref:hypothetical protein n=1 Tax=Streptomyces griseorubiginosus TaxID=67304 RepID=UPI0033AB2788